MITRRKEKVAQGIMNGKTPTEACRIAGYSEKYAHEQAYRLMHNAEFCGYLEKLKQKECERLAITEEGIISRLWKEGNQAQRSSDRINALSIVAKIRKLFSDNTLTLNAIFSEEINHRLDSLRNRYVKSIDKDKTQLIEDTQHNATVNLEDKTEGIDIHRDMSNSQM